MMTTSSFYLIEQRILTILSVTHSSTWNCFHPHALATKLLYSRIRPFASCQQQEEHAPLQKNPETPIKILLIFLSFGDSAEPLLRRTKMDEEAPSHHHRHLSAPCQLLPTVREGQLQLVKTPNNSKQRNRRKKGKLHSQERHSKNKRIVQW
ncbi:hypothetical protein D918_08448 [Trichuris suis]|nr:hypothetical protein D918_08448 [Trichuris suis]